MRKTMTVLEKPRRPIEEMERRRVVETRVEDIENHNREIFVTTQRAKWEQTTDGAIERRGRSRRVMAYQAEHRARVTERKLRLAALLEADSAEWRRELAMFGETPESRTQRLSQRAMELGARRENERRATVEAAYAKQQRLACDEVRARDSQAVLEHVTRNRASQISEKVCKERAETLAESEYVERWRAGLSVADAAESAKLLAARARRHEVKDVLDEQVESLRTRSRAATFKRRDEAKQELDEWSSAVTAESEKVERARSDARSRLLETMAANGAMDEGRDAAARELRQRDATLLEYALQKERRDDARDDAKRDDEVEMGLRYRAYLDGFERSQLVNEERVASERLEIENRIWERKDAEQRAQVDARDYLAAKVHAGRDLQMRDKQRASEEEKAYDRADLETMRRQQEATNKEQDATARAHSMNRLRNQQGVRTQVAFKKSSTAQDAQRDFLEGKKQAKVERDFERRVANEGGQVNTHHPLQSTQWYT